MAMLSAAFTPPASATSLHASSFAATACGRGGTRCSSVALTLCRSRKRTKDAEPPTQRVSMAGLERVAEGRGDVRAGLGVLLQRLEERRVHALSSRGTHARSSDLPVPCLRAGEVSRERKRSSRACERPNNPLARHLRELAPVVEGATGREPGVVRRAERRHEQRGGGGRAALRLRPAALEEGRGGLAGAGLEEGLGAGRERERVTCRVGGGSWSSTARSPRARGC